MDKILLVKYGEIALKGLNRPLFERKLINNIKRKIIDIGGIKVTKSQGRIYIEPESKEYDFLKSVEKIKKVFGIISVSVVYKLKSDFNIIKESAVNIMKEKCNQNMTFKVETKRGDKSFEKNSMMVSREVGEYILENINFLKVDVIKPEIKLYIEIREETYIYTESTNAYGGLPVGTNGKGLLLLSGGIDSPVSGWMMAKRGMEIDAIHFYSYPYTSERSKDKVIDLAKILADYTISINLHIIPFTEIQEKINEKFPKDYNTIIMRRVMINISEKVAMETNSEALITGESMGQVASQTIKSLIATDEVSNIPIFRPLIGMDKIEVINFAKRIGTYETSILPYEDCCTVFVAKHPKTKPKLEDIHMMEAKVDMTDMINDAVNNKESIRF